MSQTETIPKINYDQLGARLCKEDLSFFVQEFWDVIGTNKLHWAWYLDEICKAIQESDERVFKRLPKKADIIINVPPGTLKTKLISVFATAWEFARMPEIKVFVGSYSDGAVKSIADDIHVLMGSEKYKRFFPEVAIRNNMNTLHEFKTTKNGHFFAFTVGGTITSKHADILKVDDPLNPRDISSRPAITKTKHFFNRTLPSRKIDKNVTPLYLVMQRLAVDDPTGHELQKKKKTYHICLPATLSKNVSPAHFAEKYVDGFLDPVRLGPKVLEMQKSEMDSEADFSAQFDQEPVPEGGLVWLREWFNVIPDEDFPDERNANLLGNDWDTAYSDKEANAASAFVKSGQVNKKIFIFDFGWNWYEMPALIEWMESMSDPHYIEQKASGKSAKQVLVKNGINAIEVPIKGGEDKVMRARNATPTAAAGRVYVKKSMADKLFNDSKQGILFFPRGQYKDLADALAQALQRHDIKGMKVWDKPEADVEEVAPSSFETFEDLMDSFDETDF